MTLHPRVPLALLVALAGGLLAPGAARADVPLKTVAILERAPGQLAVTKTGQVLVAPHPYYDPDLKLARVVRGALVAWPNPVLGHGAGKGDLHLTAVTGLTVDTDGVVWILDAGGSGAPPKVLGWDPAHKKLVKVVHLSAPATASDSRPVGLAADAAHHALYIGDPAGGDDAALIVVDLETGAATRVLEGDPSVRPAHLRLLVDGHPLLHREADGRVTRPLIGVEALALDPAHTWLYYAPLTGKHLFRVKTSDLRAGGKGLSAKVQTYAVKPPCQAIAVDAKGNVYVGDVTRDAVGYLDADRHWHELAYDRRLSWPGAMALGPKGETLYVGGTQLQRSAHYHAGQAAPMRPFYLFSLTVPGK